MMFAGDRLRAAIEAVVRALGPNPNYLAAWPATVSAWDDVAQLAELTTSDDVPLPSVMRNVPALLDPPGTRAAIPTGAHVLVSFQGGDPGRPYFRPATAFGSAAFAPSALSLGSASSGPTSLAGEAVAREGDPIQAGTLSLVPQPPPAPPGTCALVWSPAIGAPIVIGTMLAAPVAGTASITGAITGGSTVVRSA